MGLEFSSHASLVPYVADTTFCTICGIIQDGIDLIAQVLENKAVAALVNGLLLHCLTLLCET